MNITSFRRFQFLPNFFIIILFSIIGSSTIMGASWTDSSIRDIKWYSENGTIFEISTPNQLGGLSYLTATGVSFKGKTIKLTNDINLSKNNYRWLSIYNFDGTFDGCNHKISGVSYITLYYNDDKDKLCYGFFRKLEPNAIVKNLVFEGYISFNWLTDELKGTNVGILAAENYGIIDNCIIIPSFDMDGKFTAEISNSVFSIGGIAGINRGKILNTSIEQRSGGGSTGAIQLTTNVPVCSIRLGGIVGDNTGGIVNNCAIYQSYKMALTYSNAANATIADKPIIRFGGFVGIGGSIINCFKEHYNSSLYCAYKPGIKNLGWSSSCSMFAGGSSSDTKIKNTFIITDTGMTAYKSAPNDETYTIKSLDFIYMTKRIITALNQGVSADNTAKLNYWFWSQNRLNAYSPIMTQYIPRYTRISLNGSGQHLARFNISPIANECSGVTKWGVKVKKSGTLKEQATYTSMDNSSITVESLDPGEDYNATYVIVGDNGNEFDLGSVSFKTIASDAVKSLQATTVTANSASIKGSYNDVGSSIKQRGFYIRSEKESEFSEITTSESNKTFESTLNELSPNLTYFYQAFIKTALGEIMTGKLLNFSTKSVKIEMDEKKSKGIGTTIKLYGTVNLSGKNVVEIKATGAGSSESNHLYLTTDSNGNFSGEITGLQPNTQYAIVLSINYDGKSTTSKTYLLSTTNASDAPAGIDGIEADKSEVVDVYSLDGLLLHTQCRLSDVELRPGVYVIVSNGKSSKIMIK